MRQRITALILTASLLLTGCNGNEAGGSNSGEKQETTSSSTQGNAPHTSEEIEGQAEENEEKTEEESGSEKIKNVPLDTEINYEFTDEDRELQGILDGLDNAWKIFITLKNFPICEEENAAIVITQLEDGLEHTYSLLSDKELPFSTIDEMKAEMSKYFTEEAIESYCKLIDAARGEIVSEDEGVYTVNFADGLVYDDNGEFYYIPQLIELNGRMYRLQAYASYLSSIDTSLVKVLKRSEDEIIFAFIYGIYTEKYTGKGIVKYENGGWKYGWIADFSNEYSCDESE